MIYSFALTQGDAIPAKVILVGTHADKLQVNKRDQIADQTFKRIRLLLASTPLFKLLADKSFVVDNTLKRSKVYDEIKQEILCLAKRQPSWGRSIPARWLPLEQKVKTLISQKIKVWLQKK